MTNAVIEHRLSDEDVRQVLKSAPSFMIEYEAQDRGITSEELRIEDFDSDDLIEELRDRGYNVYYDEEIFDDEEIIPVNFTDMITEIYGAQVMKDLKKVDDLVSKMVYAVIGKVA